MFTLQFDEVRQNRPYFKDDHGDLFTLPAILDVLMINTNLNIQQLEASVGVWPNSLQRIYDGRSFTLLPILITMTKCGYGIKVALEI